MGRRVLRRGAVWAGVVACVGLLASGCGSDDGLSRAEVEQVVEEAISDMPDSGTGISAAEMEAAIRAASEELDSGPDGVTMEQVQEAIRDAMAITDETGTVAPEQEDPGTDPQADPAAHTEQEDPGTDPQADPAAYTQVLVNEAIELYRQAGLEALLEHVNDPANVEGQWYVFVVDADDTLIGHYEPDRLGLDLKGWVGTDANGYEFGPDMLEATEAGKWVGYVYRNPASGSIGEDSTSDFELKNAWVVRHDGLLFGSGWYINVDDFIVDLVAEIADRLGSTGLEETISYFTEPQNLSGGLQQTVEYYNNAAAAGTWLGFYAEPNGTIVFHNDASYIGADITDLLGPAILDAGAIPAWITHEDNPEGTGPTSMRIRGFHQGDIIFGTGWYNP